MKPYALFFVVVASALICCPQTSSAEDPDSITIVIATPTGSETQTAFFKDAEDEQVEETGPTAPFLQSFVVPRGVDATAMSRDSSAAKLTKDFQIVSLSNWPEYKVEYKTRTIAKVMGKKIKTKVPQAFRRYCKKTLFARVAYPPNLEKKFVDDIESCGLVAAATAVAGGLATDGAGALAAFKTAFEGCIKVKLGDRAKDLDVTIENSGNCGDWTPY